MNFRELFNKLDELADVQAVDEPMANKMSKTEPMEKPNAPIQDIQKPIPGAQPQLGAKPTMVAPAVPYGDKQPQAQPVPDPKSDINAMARALQVMAMQNKQSPANSGMQSTPTSAGKMPMPVGSQSKQTIGKPGEPLEEAGDWTDEIRKKKDSTKRIRDQISGDSPEARRMRAYIAKIKENPALIYQVNDPELQQQIALEINKVPGLKDQVVKAKPEAPAQADAPKTDAPKTDAPKTDAPKTDAPKTDAPKTDAPKTDAPKTDAPKTDAPKTDAPKTDAPKTDAPKTDAPKTDAPKPENSGKEDPNNKKPTVKVGDGPTGLALAKLGITRDQRRNQEFVNKTLGPDKGYVAGTAASNLALLAAAKEKANNPAAPAAPAPAPAAPAPAPAKPASAQTVQAPNSGSSYTGPIGNATNDVQTAPAAPPSAEDDQAKFDRLAAVAREREQTANAKAYIDNLRKEYGNKDGNFMRSTGAQAIDPEGNPVYWKRDDRGGTDGSWQKLPSYHPATRQGWYSPELVDALKRTGAVPSDDKFAADKRSWYEKPFKDAEGSIKLNLKDPAAAPPGMVKAVDLNDPRRDANGNLPPETSAKEAPPVAVDNRAPVVANTLDTPGANAKKESTGYQPMKTINGVRVFDPLDIGRADANENIELHEMSTQLNLLAEELTEWSMSDRIHKDVPYSYSDAATDAGIAGLGALATYATGGLAAPIAGAATIARGGRLASMVNKAYQGSKNVAKGAREIATNPEVRAVANKNLPGVAATGIKTGTASAGVTTGLNAASDALDETNIDSSSAELERIKKLSKG